MLQYCCQILFIPNGFKFVKKIIVYVSNGASGIKKFGGFLCKMPKRILKTFFKIQLKIMNLPIHIISSLYKYLFKETVPIQCEQCKISNSALGVSAAVAIVHSDNESHGIIQEVKDIRNLMLEAIDSITGAGIIRQFEHLKRSGNFIREISEMDSEDHNALQNIPEIKKSVKHFKSRREKMNYNVNINTNKSFTKEVPKVNHIHRSINFKETQTENTEDFVFPNVLEKSQVSEQTKLKHLENDIYSKREMANERCLDLDVDRKMLNMSVDVFQSLVEIVTQENISLRRRLAVTNNKLEEVLVSSNSLLNELLKLNDHFRKLTAVSSMITNLQLELREGRRLLCEVEADRNEMQQKLFALERLIKEEEEYLDDVSCESGFDENEHSLYTRVTLKTWN